MLRLRAFLALSLALAVVGLAACGDSGDSTTDVSTFQAEDFPFTFDYPGDWSETGDVQTSTQLSNSKATKNVAVALDEDNGIFIAHYSTGAPLTADQAKVQLERLAKPLDSDAEGQTGTVGGFESVTIDGIPLKAPADGETRWVALFKGSDEYLFNCQSTPDHRDEVNAACDQAVATLKGT